MKKVKERRVKGNKNEIKSETYFMTIIALLLLIICSFGCVHLAFFMDVTNFNFVDDDEGIVNIFTRSNYNYLRNVELEDEEREIVYDGEERVLNKYPVINIANDEIDNLNNEIYSLQSEKIKAGYSINYEYGVYDKYLIVNMYEVNDNNSKAFANYIVNLDNNTVVSSGTVLRDLDLEKNISFIKVKNIVESEYSKVAADEVELYRNASLGDIFNLKLSVMDNDLCLVININNDNLNTNALRINLENYTYSYVIF